MDNITGSNSSLGTSPSEITWDDILDDDMKAIVPKFWLKFKPPSLYVHYIMGTLYAIIIAAGSVGNVLIMWLFFTTKRLQKPSYYLVINLAACDMLMLHKMVIFIYNSFMGGPAAGPHWCTYYGLVGGLSGTSAIMSIAMMSIERYACVAKPLDPKSRMTRSRALWVVGFIWIYSSTFSFMPLFGVNRYVPEGYLTSCSFNYLSDGLQDRIFIMAFFVAAWCVPMLIICWCYIGIMRSVSETQRLFLHHARSLNDKISTERNAENQRRIEIRLAKISFCLISIWTISWTPYAIVALLGIFTNRSMLTPSMSMVPALFCKSASILDPFIYGLSNRQFKSELFKRLVSFCKYKKLRNRNVTSFLMRNMSIKSRDMSVTEEHAEVSLSFENQRETALDGNICLHDGTKTPTGYDDTVDKRSNKSESSPKNLPKEQNDKGNYTKSDDNELNNNIGLKRIRVFPIPQIYVIERYNDIIKIKSRRSF